MKGYTDLFGHFVRPCFTCKYSNYKYYEYPCKNCVDIMDIILNIPMEEKDFKHYDSGTKAT